MKIDVQFFSYFKDAAGCAQASEELPDGATVGDLMRRVHERFPKLAPAARSTLIAIDLEYASLNQRLKPGDQVALFRRSRGVDMERILRITTAPIDEAALASLRKASPAVGAVVTFQGLVRDEEAGAEITGIDYEAFEAMARHQFDKVFSEIQIRWPIECVRLVHRIGFVPANEPSLWVEVTAGHRGEAFEACQYLIDQMKLRVPIWKRAVLSTPQKAGAPAAGG